MFEYFSKKSNDIVNLYKNDVNEFISTVTGGNVSLENLPALSEQGKRDSLDMPSLQKYMKKSWFQEPVSKDEMVRADILLRVPSAQDTDTSENLNNASATGFETWKEQYEISPTEKQSLLQENPDIRTWIKQILEEEETSAEEEKSPQESEASRSQEGEYAAPDDSEASRSQEGEYVPPQENPKKDSVTEKDLWERFFFRKWLREKEAQQIADAASSEALDSAWDDEDDLPPASTQDSTRLKELEERLHHYQVQLRNQVEQNHVLRKDLQLDEKQKQYTSLLEKQVKNAQKELRDEESSRKEERKQYDSLLQFVQEYASKNPEFRQSLQTACPFVEIQSSTESSQEGASKETQGKESDNKESNESSTAGNDEGEDDAFDWE